MSWCVWEAPTANEAVVLTCMDVKGRFLSASRLEGGCLDAFWCNLAKKLMLCPVPAASHLAAQEPSALVLWGAVL